MHYNSYENTSFQTQSITAISIMDVVRLRPNHMKTAGGGIIKPMRRSSGNDYTSGYTDYSTDSSTSSCTSLSHSSGNAHAPPNNFKLDGPQQIMSQQQRYSFGKSSYITGSKNRDEKTRPVIESLSSAVLPSLPALTMTTATSWTSSGEDEVEPPYGMQNAGTQTKACNMTRVHLSGIQEHQQWKVEKADPFFNILRKEILKNKPVKIEEFLIALCKSRQDGTATPVTIEKNNGTRSTTGNQINEKIKIVPKIRKKISTETFDFEVLGRSPNGTIYFNP